MITAELSISMAAFRGGFFCVHSHSSSAHWFSREQEYNGGVPASRAVSIFAPTTKLVFPKMCFFSSERQC